MKIVGGNHRLSVLSTHGAGHAHNGLSQDGHCLKAGNKVTFQVNGLTLSLRTCEEKVRPPENLLWLPG